jgi:hypothetical protein
MFFYNIIIGRRWSSVQWLYCLWDSKTNLPWSQQISCRRTNISKRCYLKHSRKSGLACIRMRDTWLDFWEPNREHLYYKNGNCEIWSFTWMTAPVVAHVYELNCYWMCTFYEGGSYGMIWLTSTSDGDTSTGANREIVTGGHWLIETWITGVRHYKLVCLLRMGNTCCNSCKVCNLLVFYLNCCEHWTKRTCSSNISFICFFLFLRLQRQKRWSMDSKNSSTVSFSCWAQQDRLIDFLNVWVRVSIVHRLSDMFCHCLYDKINKLLAAKKGLGTLH